MLTALSIRDVVLIERLDLAFGPGLTVLTGETGAGKSILLDSLGLALGARAEGGLVRAGAEQAAVAAVLRPAAGPPRLRAARRAGHRGARTRSCCAACSARDGRSRAFVNDQPVGVGAAAPGRRAAGRGAGPARADGPGRPGRHARAARRLWRAARGPARSASRRAPRAWREAAAALAAARERDRRRPQRDAGFSTPCGRRTCRRWRPQEGEEDSAGRRAPAPAAGRAAGRGDRRGPGRADAARPPQPPARRRPCARPAGRCSG